VTIFGLLPFQRLHTLLITADLPFEIFDLFLQRPNSHDSLLDPFT